MPRLLSEASLVTDHMNINKKVNLALIAFLINLNVSYSNPNQNNQLTDQEKSEGWELLFDGEKIEGWRPYESATKKIKGWVIDNGTLHKPSKVRAGNIMTAKTYEDFEFSWEWKLESKGNNGVKYFITEERGTAVGHEYQMIDDSKVKDSLSLSVIIISI